MQLIRQTKQGENRTMFIADSIDEVYIISKLKKIIDAKYLPEIEFCSDIPVALVIVEGEE